MVEVNLVKADSNSIAAGRDINIILGAEAEQVDVGKVLKLAAQRLKLPSLADSSNRTSSSTDEIAGRIIMVAQVGVIEMNGVYEDFFNEVDSLKATLQNAESAFQSQQFASAHKFYEVALETAPQSILRRVVHDFLVSGYIAHSLKSDVASLRKLLENCRQKFIGQMDGSLKIVLAEAHQEIATRQQSASMLIENGQILSDLEEYFDADNVQLLNLKGLHCRRMGERTENSELERMRLLAEADDIFRRIHELTKDRMGAEKRNNWAISLIRMFELTSKPEFLDRAEAVLNEIDFSVTALPFNDFLALPKGHNNRGNIFKQRLRRFSDSHCYADAIEAYSAAEKFWTEQDTPYEWAMIQKNKADVRCDYMDVDGFNQKTAEKALSEVEQSLKYRNEMDAPYQFNRSTEVKRRLENMLAANA